MAIIAHKPSFGSDPDDGTRIFVNVTDGVVGQPLFGVNVNAVVLLRLCKLKTENENSGK